MAADLSKFPSLSSTTHNGSELALKLLADLTNPLWDVGCVWQESLCRSVLEECEDKNILIKIDSTRKIPKKVDKKANSTDIFAKLNSFTPNQQKNHALRFGVEQAAAAGAHRGSTWGFKSFVTGSPAETRDYEDVLSQDILDAPICDVCIIQYGEAVPDGFYRLLKTPSNKKANLNSGSGGNPIYLCIKKDMTGKFAPIVNFIVIFPDRSEYVPPGYHVVQRGKTACNINTGTGSERVYLCYKKDFLGNPLIDIQVIIPSKNEETPKSFSVIEKSIGGVQANLNIGTGGPPLLICYKQELVRLRCLLNEGDAEANKRRSFFPDSIERTQSTERVTDDVPPRMRGRSVSPNPRSRAEGRSGDGKKSPASELVDSPAPAQIDPAEVLAALNSPDESSEGVADSEKVDAGAATPADKGDPMVAEDDWVEITEEGDYTREAELVYLRKVQEVVDVKGALVPGKSRRMLLAILAAVYVRQGVVSDLAVAGLSKLLKDTDFFENDLSALPLPGTITMLDLTIESVCDRFDLSSEGDHDSILQFLRICIKHSAARLSPISLQKMFRAISYLCNAYSTKSAWLAHGLSMPASDSGNDISPFKVLKELIWDTVAQVETVDIAHFLPDSAVEVSSPSLVQSSSEAYLDVRVIVEDLIDDAIDSVDVSRICEAAHQTISKQSTSTTSSMFWQLINSYSRRLFLHYQNRSAYVTLCAICKQAWLSIRTTSNGDPIPRDLGNKLIALESINEFCMCAGEKMKASKVMGYQIRRIVVPCLLFNISYAMVDHKVFAKVLKIITALWKKWRRHIRIEFAILCEQLVFKVLQASVIQIRPIFQMIVVQEVINWFDQPHMLIEMFVNYDMDRKFVSHWNTFSYLVRSMCAIGRRLSVEMKAWEWKHVGGAVPLLDSNRLSVTIRDVHFQALEEVSRMAKTLMDASGHAFLILQDSEFRNRSLGAGAGWVEDEDSDSRKHASKSGTPTSKSKAGSVRSRRAAHEESEELIKAAIKIYVDKASLKKAVAFLLSKDFMPDTPQEIANFLRVYKNSFDAEAIGEFLGEGGKDPVEEDYWSQIRFRYTRAVSFVEMDVEPALRLYLTNCGFRLPGEAQKINRFVEVFVKAFWQDNAGSAYCPFQHSDTVHLLSYAVIMLNTDLHRANTDKKRNKKMTREEFVNNLRGADQGRDIDKEYLHRIYDSIAAQPIELAVKTAAATSNHSTPTASSVTSFLKSEEKSESNKQEDMVAAALAAGKDKLHEFRIMEEKKFIIEICRGLRDSEDLLRSLAPFNYRFQSTNIDMKISLDLVSFMFETVWFHFHAIVESIFQADTADMHAKFAALDILCYSLTSSIFLDLKMERMVFASLLKRFRASVEALPHVLSNSRPIPDDSWYADIENVTGETALETIAKLHHLMVHIKDTIQESLNYEVTRQVAAKFEKKAKVLENNTFFVRQGDLNKVSRNGKAITYRFFLFSDYLLYAHLSLKKEYVVHEQLSLTALQVSDVEGDATCCSFYLSHPVKSFVVVTDSPHNKALWIRDIKHAIDTCKKRETMANTGPLNRRISMITRLESQQSVQRLEQQNSMTYSSPEQRSKQRRASYRAVMDSEPPEPDSDTTTFQTVPFSAPNSPTLSDGKKMFTGSVDAEAPDVPGIPVALPESPVGLRGKYMQSMESMSDIANIITHTQGDADGDASASSLVVTPTNAASGGEDAAAERALRQQKAVETFKQMVQTLDHKSLAGLFTAGYTFYKGLRGLPEQTQVQLLQRAQQARGQTGSLSGSECEGLAMGIEGSEEEGRREFLVTLFEAAPYWKYEQFL